MKLKPLFLYLLLLTGVAYGQKSGPLKSAWATASPFTTNPSNGQPSDNGPLPNEMYLDNTKVNVIASNTADKLFITIRLDNESDQIKALLLGSTIWLDPKGKKSTKKGINFPLPEERDADGGARSMREPGPPGQPGEHGQSERSAMVARLMAHKKDMKLIGLLEGGDAEEEKTGMLVYATGDPSGVSAKLLQQDDHLIYQLTIPLSLLNVKPGAEKPLSIGFETGTFQRPQASSGNNGGGMGGGYAGGMGGRRMGGYGGGMGGGRMGGYGGGMGNRGSFIQQTKFWVPVELAAQ